MGHYTKHPVIEAVIRAHFKDQAAYEIFVRTTKRHMRLAHDMTLGDDFYAFRIHEPQIHAIDLVARGEIPFSITYGPDAFEPVVRCTYVRKAAYKTVEFPIPGSCSGNAEVAEWVGFQFRSVADGQRGG